jgi:4-amino-4-deoxy-L-arabinose transferase-like glycosyltransferase
MDDSFIYITSARNLALGHGLAWPGGDGRLVIMTYFPPLYSILLAVFEYLGGSALVAARLVNAIAFGGNVLLVYLMVTRLTQSWGFALLGAILILVSDVLIEVHSWAMSEALYIFLALLGLLLLAIYFDTRRRGYLFAAASFTGLAFLTRYIGFSMVLAGLVTILLWQRNTRIRRVVDAAWFGLLSLLPMAIWMARNYFSIGGVLDRSPGIHLVTSKQLQKATYTLLSWFVPGRLVHDREFLVLTIIALLLIVMAVLTILGWKIWVRKPGLFLPSPTSALLLLLPLQIIFHFLVLWTSKSFFDPINPLNNRIFSPTLPSILILMVAYLAGLWRMDLRLVRICVVAFSVVFVAFYLYRSADLVPRLHQVGLGFARKNMANSPTLQAVRELPPVPLYSNSPAAIYMWANRPAYSIGNLVEMRTRMRDEHGILVLFNAVSLDLYKVKEENLLKDLVLLEDFKDGAIYLYSPK